MSSVKAQQLASLMLRVFEGKTVLRKGDETDPDYYRRLRDRAQRIQHEQRTAKRKAARAARKRNR